MAVPPQMLPEAPPLQERPSPSALSLPSTGRERVEFAALVLALTVFTTGPVYVVAVRVFSAPGTWEDPWIKYTFIAAGALGASVWISVALGGRLRRPDLAFLIAGTYTALAITSTAWSVLATYTLWRSLTYAGLLATAWVLASLSYSSFVSLLVTFCGLGAGLSMVMVVALPEVGRDGSGIWRGIYTNPNSLGPVCALLVIALLAVVLDSPSQRTRALTLALAATALVPLVASGSTTAIASLALSLAGATVVVGLASLWSQGRQRRAVVLAIFSAAAVAVGAMVLSQRVGSSTSFVERRDVWEVVWERIWIKPEGGYGFFTYFDTNASLSPRILARAGSAHNSALEATLGVGLFGFFLVSGLGMLALIRSTWAAVVRPSTRSWTWLALTVFVVLAHVTESFVSWFSYMWILLIALAWHRPAESQP